MSSVKDLDFTVSREGLCTRTECYQRLTLRKTTLYILMDILDKREVEHEQQSIRKCHGRIYK